jgi:hypothetical protein
MSTMVRATCESCGTVRLPIDACTLVRVMETRTTTTAFICPECGGRCVQRTERQTALRLAQHGIRIQDITVPDELDDPVRHDAATLALDEGWLAQLEAL